MGLVNCFDCGTPISVNADRCPKCGTMDTPMERRSAEKAQWAREKVQEIREESYGNWDMSLEWKVLLLGSFLFFLLFLWSITW